MTLLTDERFLYYAPRLIVATSICLVVLILTGVLKPHP